MTCKRLRGEQGSRQAATTEQIWQLHLSGAVADAKDMRLAVERFKATLRSEPNCKPANEQPAIPLRQRICWSSAEEQELRIRYYDEAKKVLAGARRRHRSKEDARGSVSPQGQINRHRHKHSEIRRKGEENIEYNGDDKSRSPCRTLQTSATHGNESVADRMKIGIRWQGLDNATEIMDRCSSHTDATQLVPIRRSSAVWPRFSLGSRLSWCVEFFRGTP